MTAGGSPTRVRIAAGTNRVTVQSAPGAAFSMSGKADLHDDAGQITIDRVRSSLTVTVADGCEVVIGTSTGRVRCAGSLGAVAVTTKTGRVDVDAAASLDVRATTSTVTVGAVAGTCRVHTKSGSVHIGASGDTEVSTKSGRITLSNVAGAVTAHSVTGRVKVAMSEPRDVHAETVTGRIELRLPRAAAHATTPGGELPPPSAPQNVHTRSTTGRVVVTYE